MEEWESDPKLPRVIYWEKINRKAPTATSSSAVLEVSATKEDATASSNALKGKLSKLGAAKPKNNIAIDSNDRALALKLINAEEKCSKVATCFEFQYGSQIAFNLGDFSGLLCGTIEETEQASAGKKLKEICAQIR
jgi:hypothetical protein